MRLPYRDTHMDRSEELRIKGHLYEIRTVNDEVLDSRQGFHISEEGYRKTLESVAACGGTDILDEVAEDIKDHIRTEEERPENRDLRRESRMRLAEEGIVADEYLNSA